MTPDALLSRLITIFPEFEAHWYGPDNCFREDDGTFTYCGAFSEFTHFFRDQFAQFSEPQLTDLSNLLEDCMAVDGSEIDNAAATCFLENLTSEPFSRFVGSRLRGAARRLFAQFNDESSG